MSTHTHTPNQTTLACKNGSFYFRVLIAKHWQRVAFESSMYICKYVSVCALVMYIKLVYYSRNVRLMGTSRLHTFKPYTFVHFQITGRCVGVTITRANVEMWLKPQTQKYCINRMKCGLADNVRSTNVCIHRWFAMHLKYSNMQAQFFFFLGFVFVCFFVHTFMSFVVVVSRCFGCAMVYEKTNSWKATIL